MRTILIPMTSNYVVRSVLRSDTLTLLAAAPDTRVVFLASADKAAYYRREFPIPSVFFDILPDTDRTWAERAFKWVEIASVHTRTAAMVAASQYHRIGARRGLPARAAAYAARKVFWALGSWRVWRVALRLKYALLPSDFFGNIFDRWMPDVVFAPTMLPHDAAILKEAKKRGIKTAGMVLSWDNLYSKTILRVHPDILLVHTEGIKTQAEKLGDYPAEKIRVVGIPQFDRVVRRTGMMPRADFMRSIGATTDNKLIVYALSGKAGLDIEFDILDDLYRLREGGTLGTGVEILVRPYPRYELPPDKVKRIKEEYGFRAVPAMARAGTGKDAWEFDEAALDLLVNTLCHADAVITMYSTFFIEGALADRPLIGIAYDGGQTRDYWNSAARFFEWDHLAEIKPLGGIVLVENREELAATIRACVQNPAARAEGRKKIVNQQCQYTDGASAARVARALTGMITTQK